MQQLPEQIMLYVDEILRQIFKMTFIYVIQKFICNKDTSNKTVTRQIGIWNLQSPQSSKLKCLVLRHKIAEATWRFCNLHRQFLARYFCRGLHWNPYNYLGIYLNILMMINYCIDKNRIHFWQLYWFISNDYSPTEEFILVECASSCIEYIVI